VAECEPPDTRNPCHTLTALESRFDERIQKKFLPHPRSAGCSDIELEKVYAIGPLDTTKGNDIVMWVAVHSHHEPRNNSEEATFLPYHYAEFSIRPRSFEIFKELPNGKHDHR
jgi:hypothetical protein